MGDDRAGRIAFLGLGAMGRPMAVTLLRAGWPVAVFDVRPEARAELAALGAADAVSPAAAARGAAVAVVMVRDFAQAGAVLLGPDGALDALAPATLVILMSTVAPADARELGSRCADRGLRFLDAPVSGGPGAAEGGALSVMLGGPDETVAAARPILETLGDPAKIWHVGRRAGDGQAMKMINQLMAGVNIVATSEALALAARAGLDPRQAFAIVGESAGSSWMFRDRGPRMLDGQFTPARSVLDIFVKDLGIVNDAADDLGLPLFAAAVAHQVFKLGAAAGLGGEDDAGLIRLYQRLAAGEAGEPRG